MKMVADRDGPAHAGDAFEVDLGEGEARAVGGHRNDVAPRIDDQRVAEALAEAGVVVPAALRGGEDVRLALDRAGPQEWLPVVATGRQGERGRDAEDLGPVADEPAIEVAEPEVVADRQAEPPQRRRGD